MLISHSLPYLHTMFEYPCEADVAAERLSLDLWLHSDETERLIILDNRQLDLDDG
jgi:hypothetical protein